MYKNPKSKSKKEDIGISCVYIDNYMKQVTNRICNASNVVKCVKDLDIDNIKCFTHTLQLSINSCLVKS